VRSPGHPLRRAQHEIDMNYLELLKLASPEAVVVLTVLVVLSIGLARKRAATACAFVAALGIVIGIVAVLLLPRNAALFGGMLVIDPLNSLFKIVCLALAFFTVLLTQAEKAPRHPGEYLALVLLATVGLMLLVGSEELLMIFIGLELLGLSLYVMAAFDKADVRSSEAGLKYFLFGSTSSAFTLFGISLI
jgi:NADH-quinone oxidoreductase subunit N